MNPDVVVFRFINVDMGWEFLSPLMKTVSHLPTFVPVIIALVVWMVWRDGVRGRVTVIAFLVLVPATDQLSSAVLKPAFHRPRPCRPEASVEGVRNHGVHCSGKGSFPSSHAANIGAAAFLMAWRYRRCIWLATAIAFLVGYSRVYLGLHYPLDILGGWALGALLGWGAARGAAWLDTRGGRYLTKV